MKLYIIMHESFEAPRAIETWAKRKNHEVTYTRLYNSNTFPQNVGDIKILAQHLLVLDRFS